MSTTQALVDRHDAARVVGRSPQQPRLDGRRRGLPSGCMQQRMMYVELKTGYDIDRGPAWISRVDFSRSGRTVYFHGRVLRRARSFDANHIDAASGDRYWVSGPRRDRSDRRSTNLPVHWTTRWHTSTTPTSREATLRSRGRLSGLTRRHPRSARIRRGADDLVALPAPGRVDQAIRRPLTCDGRILWSAASGHRPGAEGGAGAGG